MSLTNKRVQRGNIQRPHPLSKQPSIFNGADLKQFNWLDANVLRDVRESLGWYLKERRNVHRRKETSNAKKMPVKKESAPEPEQYPEVTSDGEDGSV